jgi:hypothetical protein
MLVSTIQNLYARETWHPVFMHAWDFYVFFEGTEKERNKFRLVDLDPSLKTNHSWMRSKSDTHWRTKLGYFVVLDVPEGELYTPRVKYRLL